MEKLIGDIEEKSQNKKMEVSSAAEEGAAEIIWLG